MFRAGRIYWARSEDGYSIRVECVRRTERTGTFKCSDGDAPYMGLKRSRFTKRIEQLEAKDIEGLYREAVTRVAESGVGSR